MLGSRDSSFSTADGGIETCKFDYKYLTIQG